MSLIQLDDVIVPCAPLARQRSCLAALNVDQPAQSIARDKAAAVPG